MRYKGETCWKSAIEYNPEGRLHGTPYFVIAREVARDGRKNYYLYEFDVKLQKYFVLIETDSFDELYETGCAKENALRDELRRKGELFTITWEP